ncbi:MAG: 15-cis-phytoene synthase [Chloroflexia bacterium]|jgi:phytoene synthase|nr:15-cis-phytoene synthase [Chloroflexia bacterium]
MPVTETHLHPPASVQVLERLAEYLTPPHNLAFVSAGKPGRRGGYDSLGYHCLAEAQKPTPDKVWAYRQCTEIIKQHSKSFYFSARLLPVAKRAGIMALYAFCRVTDDLVDEAGMEGNTPAARLKAGTELDRWALACHHGSDHEHAVVQAWHDTRSRFGIPRQLPEELLAGIRMDLTLDRYDTWDDLWVYCYRVASTVGLMSMYITGTETMEAVPYAVQLGVALQLTNILRDVGEDARAGRIYLPAEDMARFGYTREMLMSGTINRNFIRLLDFEMERAHALYNSAWRGIAMLPADSRPAIAAAATVYRGILDKIVELNYDVFNNRAHLSMGEKARSLPRVWWQARHMRHTGAQEATQPA